MINSMFLAFVLNLNRPNNEPYQLESNKIVLEKKQVQVGMSEVKNHGKFSSFDSLFQKYAQEYDLDWTKLKRIAECESGLNSEAVNGPYAGLFQFLGSTWVSNRKAMGLDSNPELRFNAEEAIRTAAFKISRDGTGAWPVCGLR